LHTKGINLQLTDKQKEIIARYNEATKDDPDSRLPVEKLLGLSRRIPKYRPSNHHLKKLEEERINEPLEDQEVSRGRPKKAIINNIVLDFLSPYFNNYSILSETYYWIDDVFTGVSRLDLGGNKRDISKYHLFDILSVCAKIDADFVGEYLHTEKRQSQKIMLALSVAHRMLEKEIVVRVLNVLSFLPNFCAN
jgi:hypothetical protein